jgi:hypothetical protein
MTLLTACNDQQLTSNYTFRYTVENFALGPIDGVKSYEVVVKDNKPVQVANTASGIMLSSVDKADGLNAIMKVISDKQNDYRVKYYKNGFPKEIKDPDNNDTDMVGSPYMEIYLFDYQNVDKNFNIEPNIQERYLNANYKRWSSLNLLDYRFRYQDSKIKQEHFDGVRIKVVDNKIASLVDERTLTSFSAENTDEFLTIDEFFTKIKGELSDKKCLMKVNYDIENGYPSYVYYKCSEDNTREIVLFNLKSETK